MIVIVFLPVLVMAGISHGRSLKGASAERAAKSETGSKVNYLIISDIFNIILLEMNSKSIIHNTHTIKCINLIYVIIILVIK